MAVMHSHSPQPRNRATHTQAIQIGVVAKKTGLSIDAIRFYERAGLISVPPRTAGGFRLYEESALDTLLFIRRVQHLGFTLAEIRDLLALRARPLQSCAPVRRRLQQKMAHIQNKLSQLQKLEAELSAALRKCNSQMQKSSRCPILQRAKPIRCEARNEN